MRDMGSPCYGGWMNEPKDFTWGRTDDTLPEPQFRPGDPGYAAALKAAIEEAGWGLGTKEESHDEAGSTLD